MKRMLMVVGAALAAMSVIAQEVSSRLPSIKTRRASCRSARQKLPMLEQVIPIGEALALAKDGKGKGFYQLALRYAGGNELPRDSKLAYQMLCKARDLDYANAVLVEGLCDEHALVGLNKDNRALMDIWDYCGIGFVSLRCGCDSLTNEVAFARVMGKYEKAKALGALTATNQIIALNKRLADFTDAKAKLDLAKSQAEENNKKVLDLLATEGANRTVIEMAGAQDKKPSLSRAERRRLKEREEAAQEEAAQEEAQRLVVEKMEMEASRERDMRDLQRIREALESMRQKLNPQTKGSGRDAMQKEKAEKGKALMELE